MSTIFVVIGSHGEYEDYHEWIVRAFHSEDHATTFASDLMNDAYRVSQKFSSHHDLRPKCSEEDPDNVDVWREWHHKNQQISRSSKDPEMHELNLCVWGDGPRYSVVSVEIV